MEDLRRPKAKGSLVVQIIIDYFNGSIKLPQTISGFGFSSLLWVLNDIGGQRLTMAPPAVFTVFSGHQPLVGLFAVKRFRLRINGSPRDTLVLYPRDTLVLYMCVPVGESAALLFAVLIGHPHRPPLFDQGTETVGHGSPRGRVVQLCSLAFRFTGLRA
ncbi:hypothetical protein [Rhodovibrio sodomensis]|uniref:hypothetical protein n=1 Tax=Rhodovibrio sodomensis TaxID=1088 RepID=UPI0019052F36